VNEVEGAGNTPLHCAAYEGWAEGVQLLLSLGAKVNASNNAGDRPWHWARNMDHPDVMELLERVRSRPLGYPAGAAPGTTCRIARAIGLVRVVIFPPVGQTQARVSCRILQPYLKVVADVMQNGASREQGQVIVPDHIPKVKVRAVQQSSVGRISSHVMATLQNAEFCRTSFKRTAGHTTQSPTQSLWSGGPQRIVRLRRSGQN